MKEADAVEKMEELQDSLSTAMKYSSARDRFPTMFIIALLALFGSVMIILLADYYDYLTYSPQMGTFPLAQNSYIDAGVFVALLWLFVLYIEYSTLNRAYRKSVGVNWENELKEGVLGILKIIEGEDWEEILNHLRKAKQSFLVISILQFIINWIFVSLVLWFFYEFVIEGIFAISLNSLVVLPMAAILVLVFGDRSLKKSYSRLWQVKSSPP